MISEKHTSLHHEKRSTLKETVKLKYYQHNKTLLNFHLTHSDSFFKNNNITKFALQ
jgi:hypothetical protein